MFLFWVQQILKSFHPIRDEIAQLREMLTVPCQDYLLSYLRAGGYTLHKYQLINIFDRFLGIK